MTPLENSMYKTLNLLVMLSRSKKQLETNLSEVEKATLTINKQILIDAGLTVPEFTNSLQELSKKGYVWHMVFFDDDLRLQMNEFINSPIYSDYLENLKTFDTVDFSDKMKVSIRKDLEGMVPEDTNIEEKDLGEEELKLSELFMDGIEKYKKMPLGHIALIILMPFREIDRLYTRVGNGEKFADIKDDGFWYDQTNFIFHIEGESISTEFHSEATLVHYILKEFFNNPALVKVDYENIAEFDLSKGNEAYRDAMRRFIRKHPKLKDIFTARLYQTEFHPAHY